MIQERAKRVAFHTLGCRLNQAETLAVRDRFEGAGYEIVSFDAEADIAIINTCTVTRIAESKCRQSIRGFQRRNPNAYVAIVGCYSQTGYKELSRMDGIDLILGNHDKMNVIDYIGDAQKSDTPVIVRERIDRSDFSLKIVGDKPYDKRANLKVQDGCDFFCSFCIIPFARGHARSRDFNNLLEEAQHLANRGVKELVLTGVNIGTYANAGRDIVDIVDALNSVPGICRVRISSIEPTTIPLALFERMADGNHSLMPFLHIPLQSGSERILREMKRKYTIHEYLQFIEHAATQVPDLCIGTDILVGFPGETEADFQDTCNILMDSPLAFSHVFTYSERDMTPAQKRHDHVSIPERQERSSRLRRLSAKKKHDFYTSFLGREMEVLFEDPREGTWPGYTANYIRVVATDGENLRNQVNKVRLEAISADYVEASLTSPSS